MKIYEILIFFIPLYFFTLHSMEEQEYRPRNKGKEREKAFSYDSALKELLDGSGLDEPTKKEDEKISLKSALQSPSQRRRLLSLSFKNSGQSIKKENISKRRSLDSLLSLNDSEFEQFQKEQVSLSNLFALKSIYDSESYQKKTRLDQIESWIDFAYGKIPKNCDTIEGLNEVRYELLTFMILQLEQEASHNGDFSSLEYAHRQKEKAEADKKDLEMRVNFLEGEGHQTTAEIFFMEAEALTKLLSEKKSNLNSCNGEERRLVKTEISELMSKQNILYNIAQAYCSEAKHYFENSIKNGYKETDELLSRVNNLLYLLHAKIKKLIKYDQFRKFFQSSEKYILKAQKLEKKIQPWSEFNEAIEQKKLKISPRTRTEKQTKGFKQIKSKLDEIIKKEYSVFETNHDKERKDFSLNIMLALNKLVEEKREEEYYKAIIDYKIKKNNFNYMRALKAIEKNYKESSENLRNAFKVNPHLPILVTLKLNIERIKRINEKIKVIGEDTDNQKFLTLFNDFLDDSTNSVARIQKSMGNKYSDEGTKKDLREKFKKDYL